jgi:hypothetical protein
MIILLRFAFTSAKAGIQAFLETSLDSRFRGNDGRFGSKQERQSNSG